MRFCNLVLVVACAVPAFGCSTVSDVSNAREEIGAVLWAAIRP